MSWTQNLSVLTCFAIMAASVRDFFRASKPVDPPRDEEYRAPPEVKFPLTYGLPGLYNFRDIGGYTVSDGRIVRHGVVFRSANLDYIRPVDLQSLRQTLGIRCIFDLRSHANNCGTDVWNSWEGGMAIHHTPAMDWEKSRAPLQEHFSLLSQDLVAAFIVIYKYLTVESAPAFAKIFTHIIDNPGRPLIIHCDLGKDRTGIFIAVLLKVLGVSEAEIVEDYHRTEGQIDALIGPKSEKYRRSTQLKQPITGLENHFLAPRETMRGFLEYIETAYGGVSGYMGFLGFSAIDIERIREHLLLPVNCTIP